MCVGNKNLFHAMLPTTHILRYQNVLFTTVFWGPLKICVGNDYFFCSSYCWSSILRWKCFGEGLEMAD